MIRRLAGSFLVIGLALIILLISVLRVASTRYVFSQSPTPIPVTLDSNKMPDINYNLPYSGKILPDNFFWTFKVLRDKIWLLVTTNPLKKAEILLLLSEKRLTSGQELVKRDNISLGISILTKAEKYLEQAQKEERRAKKLGMNTSDFLEKLANSSLKHRQILEEILLVVPEDAKPVIVKTTNYPKQVFQDAQVGLVEIGKEVHKNPFENSN